MRVSRFSIVHVYIILPETEERAFNKMNQNTQSLEVLRTACDMNNRLNTVKELTIVSINSPARAAVTVPKSCHVIRHALFRGSE